MHTPAQISSLIHEGFDVFYAEFKRLTRECRQLFDARDWIRIHEVSRQRIDLYGQYVRRTLAALRPITAPLGPDEGVWREAHNFYREEVRSRVDSEVAETFFNAITRKIFQTVGVKPEIEFLDSEIDPADPEEPGLYTTIEAGADLVDVFGTVLRCPRPALRWIDLHGEALYLASRFGEVLTERYGDVAFDRVDVIRTLFFRVREAYIVGRVWRGNDVVPLVIPIQSIPGGVVVDGGLFSVGEILPVFSSTRAYLFVEVDKPWDLVRFLGTLMPRLTPSELYIAIAHHRHGKTMIYRELVEHLDNSDDRFIVAPGIKGLVMTVFTMPSYRNVFKIIRDSFDKPGATREGILRSYRDVFRGRRVGRLADTQEFEHLAFDRNRFTDECLKELLDKAASTVRVDGDKVVVSHVYIEEKMTPLNIHLLQAPLDEARRAIVDYGDAIRELAANNIFAGDLLWKNFGVTLSGQLVLYDYDEICAVLDCNFRRIPPPRSWEDEMSAKPYYAVADADVFPEEWPPFIVPRQHPALRDAFLEAHGELLTPEFWRSRQRHILAGELHIGLPYTPRHPELQREPVHRSGAAGDGL